MRKKGILSVLLVGVYFVMGVATSRMPRDVAYYNKGPLNINDSKHIIYFENFNSNKNNWPEGRFANGEYYFDKGHYVMSNQEADKIIIQDILTENKINPKDDWMLELSFLEMELEGDAKASILWGKKGTDYISYAYSQQKDGVHLDYGKNVEGAWVGASKEINGFAGKYKTVKLGIHKTAGKLDYYLNNKFVFSGPVENFFGDQIAIAIEGKAKVVINEIVIKQLQFRERTNNYSTNREATNYTLENKEVIPMRKVGDYFLIPITINNSISTNFILDTWTTDMVVSEAMAKQLIGSGTVKDYIDDVAYTFRDGSSATSARFIVEKIQLGNKSLDKVECLILANASQDILIGKSVLNKIGKYELDTQRKLLVFDK